MNYIIAAAIIFGIALYFFRKKPKQKKMCDKLEPIKSALWFLR